MTDFLANGSSTCAVLGLVILLLISKPLWSPAYEVARYVLIFPVIFILVSFALSIILSALHGILKILGY